METRHEVVVEDARTMAPTERVELVVTSPPYPMIEMWDGTFERLNPAIAAALDRGESGRAFELMHAELDSVWDRVAATLVEGGIACINVGDATRSLDGDFRCYPNHARIIRAFIDRGFRPLPPVLWRKPTNRATKFMGSGMLPPNAYVTLEHEYVLVFRKGSTREFEPNEERRYESAYFWEERNEWFSDLWEVTGEEQAMDEGVRDRSGAFPVEIPYRLINMYSAYGDTVLDPFLGTGTTTLAAMLTGRNSIGFEIDPDLAAAFDERLDGIEERSHDRARERLDRHRSFVEAEREAGETFAYEADHYDFPVRTKQETGIRLYGVEAVVEDGGDLRGEEMEDVQIDGGGLDGDRRRFVVRHEPI